MSDFIEWKKCAEQFSQDLKNLILSQNPENDFKKIDSFGRTDLMDKKIIHLLDNTRLNSLFEKIK